MDKTDAKYGEVVTVTCDPDDGWRFDEISVIGADGKPVEGVSFVREDVDYVVTYVFTMPAGAVDVVVTYTEEASSDYTDVMSSAWYYDAVKFVSDRGYMVGTAEDIFAPYEGMTRAMFVTVISRLEGIDTAAWGGECQFKDVAVDSWYCAAVNWAADAGVVNGYSADTFGPMDLVTREQMCAIMYRYAQYKGYDMTVTNANWMGMFADIGAIDAYAKDATGWCVSWGVLNGSQNGRHLCIEPQRVTYRCEAAQVIRNFVDKVMYR